MKKCKHCKKNKPLSDFYQNQADCKQCSKDMRNLENHARNCNETEWLKNAEKDALLLAYSKEREHAEKERTKVKFSMTTYKQRTVHAAGVRKEGRRRFMTEHGYYAWSQLKQYCEIDFSSFWQNLGFGGCFFSSQLECIGNLISLSFWQNLGFGG